MSERKLQDIMIVDEHWGSIAREAHAEGIDSDRQALRYSIEPADAVVDGQYSVAFLRACVAWANTLDREAVELSGSIVSEDDKAEKEARSIAHKGMRIALNRVKSSARRQSYMVNYVNRLRVLEAQRQRVKEDEWRGEIPTGLSYESVHDFDLYLAVRGEINRWRTF